MADRSIIGRSMAPVTMTVERGKIMEFARSILDDNPVYFGPDPAVPLTFGVTTAHWQTGKADLTGLDLARLLHGGLEFEYLGEIHAGDTLTSRGSIVDVYEKQGSRGGSMTFVESETIFTNQHGEDVLTMRSTLIETSRAATQDGS
ncbi:acyl dehydratase [Kibdelosporangium banguiense]|uniref:Acyl dehydratase n=1 Tax=Kibdelosporangium banguiense TaxID=1365924 RepID=A0ABS4TUG9_9PSEU|nr:MaoC family dehydratase N-terminal domain-containing protein [Kibdelosporangium banguiense]MBP2328053.1 acyl dehydratase [Kibdelosporangium banguiense]